MMLDRTSISQEIADIGRHSYCQGPPTLPKTSAMGNSDMGRYTFRATAIIDNYFYYESLWLPNSSFGLQVGTGEFFIIGLFSILWSTDIT